MNELTEILGVTVTQEISGATLNFSKITLGMMADYETIMLTRQVKLALEAAGQLDAAERADLIRAMTRQGAGRGIAETLETPEGLCLILWLALKPQHPDMTEEDLRKLLTIDQLSELTALLDRLTDAHIANESEGLADSGNAAKEAGATPP